MSGEVFAKTLFMISNVAFAIAAVCAVLAVIFFIMFKIPSVIDDLSGKNARKSIAQMRSHNEQSGNKSFRPSKTNESRVKLTDTMTGIEKSEESGSEYAETDKLDENMIRGEQSEETDLLDDDMTGLLNDPDETALLENNTDELVKCNGGMKLQMLDEVIFIHTDETIS